MSDRGAACRGAARPAWAMILAALLAACGSAPTLPVADEAPPAVVPAPPAGDPRQQAFELAQAERASRAEAQGHWAEAALAWEVLALLRPDDEPTRNRLAAVRQRIETASRERLAAADAAQRRGDLEAAAQAHLELLALDPGRSASAEALRQIERERNRRSLLGRSARLAIARRGAEAEPHQAQQAAEPARNANSLREHATMLVRQGDVDGAIQIVRDSPLWRGDAALKTLLVELYLQRAESLRTRSPQAARAAVDAALAVDRRHAGALALQQNLNRAAKAAAAASAPGTAPAGAAAAGARKP